MPFEQHRPCALVAGDPPIMTARRTTVLVIVVSLVLGANLLGDDHERVLLVLLACAGAPVGLFLNGPLVVLNLRFRPVRSGDDVVSDL
ncbi:hypothetical protein ABZ342_44350 [Amycolatopsis sp. NPDC005961]|uniref:hypothetical protein n=1 Tax=Amycolatopsis sp. NPDC005961 TaxID=3156720 RepID=UPI0033C7796F